MISSWICSKYKRGKSGEDIRFKFVIMASQMGFSVASVSPGSFASLMICENDTHGTIICFGKPFTFLTQHPSLDMLFQHAFDARSCGFKVQCTTTTLRTQNLWPLLSGRRCSKVALCYANWKLDLKIVVTIDRWLLLKVSGMLYKLKNDLKAVVAVDKWSIFWGGH